LFWLPELYEKAGLLELSDPARAIRLLSMARQNSALSPVGQLALGDAYQNLGETDSAVQEWENLLDRKQEIPAVGLRLANKYHASQQFDDEKRVLSPWLEADPFDPQVNERMGLLLAASADPQALPLLENAASDSAQSASRLAQLLAALKTNSPQQTYKLTLCAQALAGMNEWALAEQALSLAVQPDTQYPSAWAWLGLVRQHNGKPGALEALEHAINLDPKSASLHAMLGTYWQQSGETQKAAGEFELATRLEPGNPGWWLALAGSKAGQDLPAALQDYTHAVGLEPKNPANWYALAAFCVEQNAFVEDYGLNAALRAFALEPGNPLYMDMLGRAQMAVGQAQAAEVMFNKALKSGQPNQLAGFHFHLGLLYLQTERNASAKDEFEQTRKADPQGPYGAQAQKLLERYFP
jgi:tetratricopeptide (TPR) repeat protein